MSNVLEYDCLCSCIFSPKFVLLKDSLSLFKKKHKMIREITLLLFLKFIIKIPEINYDLVISIKS